MLNNDKIAVVNKSRRGVVMGAGAAAVATVVAASIISSGDAAHAATPGKAAGPSTGGRQMGNMVVTKDGVEIFYKDWGAKDAQPIVFHHGWEPSAQGQVAARLAHRWQVGQHQHFQG